MFPAAALLLFIGAWLLRRRSRGLLAGLLFFAGTLFPALGFFNVFPFRYSFVADHFQYLAGIGPIALTAAGIAISFRCLTDRNAFIKPAFYGILLALLGMLTWQQARMYVNGETLWRTTLERNPNSWMAYGNLGRELLIRGDENNGLACIEKALEIKPDYLEIHDLLGQVLFGKGRLDEAIEHYKKVLEIRPTDWHGYYNLGFVLIQNGQLDEAIFNFKRALKLQPNEAIIHKTLGEALLQKGQLPDAAVHFKKYLEVQPDSIEVLNNLAWLLATSEDPNVRDGSRAVQLAEHACELTGSKKTTYLGTLAAAYAEAGKFTEAITTAQNACALAGKSGETNLLQKNQELLELYRAHKPYRDAPSPR